MAPAQGRARALRPTRSRVAVISLGLLLIAPQMASAAPVANSAGVPRAAAPSVRAPVAQETPTAFVGGDSAAPQARIALSFRSLDDHALRAAKLHAAAAASVGGRTPEATVVTPALAEVTVNKGGLVDHFVTPPDSTGAIGPSHYVEMVNQQVGVYDRNLNAVSSTDLTSFVAASGWTVSDPQIEWDQQSGRWLYAAVGIASGNNVLLFGWSKNADPSNLTSGWCRFGVYRDQFLDDYPKLGHDDNYLTIGSNVYDDTVPGYGWVTATIWAIPKPAVGDTSCAVPASAYNFADGANPLLNADGSPASTPVPANNAGGAPVGYVVAGHSPLDDPVGPRTDLMVWHVMPAGGGPAPTLVTDGDVAVGSFDVPAPAPQPGTTFKLDTLDARLTQAVATYDPSAGAVGLWTQHTVAGPGGRSVVRWYELLPATLAVRQQGQVESASDFVFNGAISPTAGGNAAAVFFNRSSSVQATVIGGQTRNAATPLGSMEPGELLIGTGTTFDRDFSCSSTTPCRWGDYSGATPDPLNSGVVWGSNQVTGACYILCGWFAQWTTRNFAVVASEPTPPTVPGAPSLDPATAGDAQVGLTWTAPLDDGGAAITDYIVYRSELSGAETPLANSGGALNYTDTTVTNGTTYYYTVAAVNSVGTGTHSNEVSATPEALPPPGVDPPGAPGLTGATGGDSQVTLTWTAPLDDGGAAITNYQVLRGTSSGGEVVVATVGDVLTYTDPGLSNGQAYYYVVAAVNSAGAGPVSNEMSAVPKAAPSAPRSLAAKAKSSQIKLTWLAPLSDGGAGITAYEVWRGTSSGGEVKIATIGNVLTFVDPTVVRRTTYYYIVRAVNGFGLMGPYSNEVSLVAR
ncbi:MAG: fibronectin type III domain-containing protein [Chloroflexota bacterium]